MGERMELPDELDLDDYACATCGGTGRVPVMCAGIIVSGGLPCPDCDGTGEQP